MKANELRKSLLASGMDPAEAEHIVKSRVSAGGIQEDTLEFTGPGLEEIEAMEKAASEVVESWDAEAPGAPEAEDIENLEFEKSGDPEAVYVDAHDGEEDVTEIIEEFAKAADSVASAVVSRYDGLAKAVHSSSFAVTALAKATWQMQSDLQKALEDLGDLRKSLNMPIPPRSVSGSVEAVPAPGEQEMDNVVGLKDKLITKAMSELQNPDTPNVRRQELAKAMARLDTFGDPSVVADVVNGTAS